MIKWLCILFSYQLIGELISDVFSLAIPGPVIGMAFLFVTLLALCSVPEHLSAISDGLLKNMAVLFVPAGVGIMLHAKLLQANWLALAVAVLLSTFIGVAISAASMAFLMRLQRRRGVRRE